MPDDPDTLVHRFLAHDRRALASLLTLAERGTAPTVPDGVPTSNSTDRSCLVVGITGSGGTGKSTLIGTLIGHLRAQGKRVAVLASDPQSPVSGGALLGDRLRVQFAPDDEGVFFRSFSTRGAPGGVSAATGPALAWLKAFGFDVVLIETVGVGQDQVAVRQLVDRLVLLVTPGSGDEVQWEKAGLIELADVVVVNKCDLPGADHVIAELRSALSLVPGSQPPPVLGIVATRGEDVAQLWEEIARA